MGAGATPSGAILVIGASLEAERIVHLIRTRAAPIPILGLIAVDPATERVGPTVAGLPVLDTIDNLSRYRDRIIGAVPAAAEAHVREAILAALVGAGIPALPLVHPHASTGHGVQVGPGAVVHTGAVLDIGVRVGRGAVIGAGAIIGPRTRVGDYAEVEAGVVVGRSVRIGERARLGIGCRVIDGVLLGPDSIAGPGSLVAEDLAGGAAVIGAPARPVERIRHPEADPA
jgi:UDP-3-O-[3-hydroxymyristoyl] glucosamine N-acyltransferase